MVDYATLLRDHVTLTCRSIDRLFLQAYVPKLQSVGQVCRFLRWQRAFKIPSSAAFGQIGEAYVAAIHRWAETEGIPIRYFAKGDNKDKITRRTRTWSGVVRWSSSITFTFTCGILSGGRPSGRPTPTRRTRSGSG